MRAKAGETISRAARARLGQLWGMTGPWPDDTVATKSRDDDGQWLCATCGLTFANNAQAMGHEFEHDSHRLAWLSFTSQNIEEA
ncbi:MAG: hypothetical protein JRD89_03510 [Deltaproteobacteria bacterium]|nr:hypothetical protein [Deltaproteobacteria bacterium]